METVKNYNSYQQAWASGKSFNIFEEDYVSLQGADLRGADLQGADLRYADLRGADLHDANLRSADLRYADLRGADLFGADLQGANLRGANLRGADLRGANLYGADLQYADLYDADLRYADLRYADLRYADLRYADLRYADLQGAKGIVSITCIGLEKRFLFSYVFDSEIRIQAGCFNGTIKELTKAVNQKYGLSVNTQGRQEYMVAMEFFRVCLNPYIDKDKIEK